MTPGPAAEEDEFANEAPLLEELGINVEHIMQKTYAVLNPFHATHPDVAGDSDLAGPLVFCLAFGSFLLLCGKVHFNYIYGIGFMGCAAMYGLISMMSSHVSFTVIVSILGYCVLPIVMLSGMSVLFSLQGLVGNVITGGFVLWCAVSASNLFVLAFRMEHQQVLVAYPCSLLYAVFALITVF
uniref:Protein YIPF n=2 Tax=Lepeophtheirus salmonis TaxID=72036 RepID=A0A0K2U7R6_LEPSM